MGAEILEKEYKDNIISSEVIRIIQLVNKERILNERGPEELTVDAVKVEFQLDTCPFKEEIIQKLHAHGYSFIYISPSEDKLGYILIDL